MPTSTATVPADSTLLIATTSERLAESGPNEVSKFKLLASRPVVGSSSDSEQLPLIGHAFEGVDSPVFESDP